MTPGHVGRDRRGEGRPAFGDRLLDLGGHALEELLRVGRLGPSATPTRSPERRRTAPPTRRPDPAPRTFPWSCSTSCRAAAPVSMDVRPRPASVAGSDRPRPRRPAAAAVSAPDAERPPARRPSAPSARGRRRRPIAPRLRRRTPGRRAPREPRPRRPPRPPDRRGPEPHGARVGSALDVRGEEHLRGRSRISSSGSEATSAGMLLRGVVGVNVARSGAPTDTSPAGAPIPVVLRLPLLPTLGTEAVALRQPRTAVGAELGGRRAPGVGTHGRRSRRPLCRYRREAHPCRETPARRDRLAGLTRTSLDPRHRRNDRRRHPTQPPAATRGGRPQKPITTTTRATRT